MLFQFVYAASIPVRFVTELDLGRRSSGTLYVPLTSTSATQRARRRKCPCIQLRTQYSLRFRQRSKTSLEIRCWIRAIFQWFPRYQKMEPPVLGVNPPKPVPEPEPPEKAASPSDDSKAPLVRVGGRVVPAQIIFQQAPIYPENARRARVQGAVVLNAVVSLKAFCRKFEL